MDLISGGKSKMNLTITDTHGKPVSGVIVSGVVGSNGETVYSDSNGLIDGYVGEGTVTLSINGYADIENRAQSYTFVRGNTYTYTWQVTRRSFISYASSTTTKFSGDVTSVSASAVGGGGGGAGAYVTYGSYTISQGGAGGGGGYAEKGNFTPVANQIYPVTVGSGGSLGGVGGPSDATVINYCAGKDGGSSSIFGITANGGGGGGGGINTTVAARLDIGGTGNGNGGNSASQSSDADMVEAHGANGKPGTQTYYSSYSEESPCGGGGGGGSHMYGAIGGSPNGGNGGYYNVVSGGTNGIRRPTSGGVPGGGGGGGSQSTGFGSNWSSGSSGGKGIVTIRMNLKYPA